MIEIEQISRCLSELVTTKAFYKYLGVSLSLSPQKRLILCFGSSNLETIVNIVNYF